MDKISEGYCQCGCGGKPSICKQNNKTLGRVKGKPYKFLKGHAKVRTFLGDMPLCACGCGLPVTISKITDKNGIVLKGFPNRFIRGHNANIKWDSYKKRHPENVEEDALCKCGCGEFVGFYKRNNKTRGEIKGKRRKVKPGHIIRTFGWIGEKNPAWKGDHVGKRSGNKRARGIYPLLIDCERCSKDGKVRHHKDRNPLNNERNNVEFLCNYCHWKEHRTDRLKKERLA